MGTEAHPGWIGNHKILPVEFIQSTNRTNSNVLLLSIQDYRCKPDTEIFAESLVGKFLPWSEVESIFNQIEDVTWVRMILTDNASGKDEYIQFFDSSTWEVTNLD